VTGRASKLVAEMTEELPFSTRQPSLATTVGADGLFEFPKVLPGKYRIQPYPRTPGSSEALIVVTDKDVGGIDIVAPPERTIRGRARFEDGSPAFNLTLSFMSAAQPVGVA
jgi:hypothetical protein